MSRLIRILIVSLAFSLGACSVQEVQEPPPKPTITVKPVEVPVPKPAYRPKTDAYKETNATKVEQLDSKTRIVLSEDDAVTDTTESSSESTLSSSESEQRLAANAADDAELERESDKLDPYINKDKADVESTNEERKIVLANNETTVDHSAETDRDRSTTTDEPNLAEKAEASKTSEFTQGTEKAPENTDDTVKSDDLVEETSPAVMSLMIQSRVDVIAGRDEAAVEKLERGLRIEPENPDLWNKLAEINLQQGNYDQAVTMAEKSLQLNQQNNKELQRRNQSLIVKARKRQANEEAAKASQDTKQMATP